MAVNCSDWFATCSDRALALCVCVCDAVVVALWPVSQSHILRDVVLLLLLFGCSREVQSPPLPPPALLCTETLLYFFFFCQTVRTHRNQNCSSDMLARTSVPHSTVMWLQQVDMTYNNNIIIMLWVHFLCFIFLDNWDVVAKSLSLKLTFYLFFIFSLKYSSSTLEEENRNMTMTAC